MIALNLYWKHNGDDLNLGVGWHEVAPPAGGLLVFVTDHGTVWKVVTHLQHLAVEGSMAVVRWRHGGYCDPPEVTLFVEPAEGPFEP